MSNKLQGYADNTASVDWAQSHGIRLKLDHICSTAERRNYLWQILPSQKSSSKHPLHHRHRMYTKFMVIQNIFESKLWSNCEVYTTQ